jgi:hypothetical protein
MPGTWRIGRVFLAPAGVLPPVRRRLRLVISAIAMLGSVASSLWCYPHSLSYFNELAGGPANGHRHMLGSAISWGQDLLYLKEWCDAHPQARPLYVAIVGLVNPRFAGLEFELPPLGGPNHVPPPGWYVIDVNFLAGSQNAAPNGRGGFERVWRYCPNPHRFFQFLQPTGRIGWSFMIFRVSDS